MPGAKTWPRPSVPSRSWSSCSKSGGGLRRLGPGPAGRCDMATVRIPSEGTTLTEASAVRERLAAGSIQFERWQPSPPVGDAAPPEEVLAAYSVEIDRLKKEGGFVTADLIDVNPATPGLDAMLAKFSREHWHDEDEGRFILEGRGGFHIHPREGGPVIAIEVGPGDRLRVPRGPGAWSSRCA